MTRRVLTASLLLLLPLSGCRQKTGIEGLNTFDFAGGDVRSGSLTYTQRPPAGGPHNALWQSCGVYAAPLYDEYAVSSLARGVIWATYRPDLPAEQKTALLNAVKAVPRVLVSPYPAQQASIVLTAWNAQLFLNDVKDGRLPAFLTTYAEGKTAPLQGMSCRNGFQGTR